MKLLGILIGLIVLTSGCLVSQEKIQECRELQIALDEKGDNCTCEATNNKPNNLPDEQKDLIESYCKCDCFREDGTPYNFYVAKPAKQN